MTPEMTDFAAHLNFFGIKHPQMCAFNFTANDDIGFFHELKNKSHGFLEIGQKYRACLAPIL